MVTLIYSHSKTHTGTENYSIRLIKGLKAIGTDIKEIRIEKREISLFGKPLGGAISQFIGTWFKNPEDEVVHSTSINVVNRKTNVVTVHDLIPLQMNLTYSTSAYRRLGYFLTFKNIQKVPRIIVFTDSLKQYIHEHFGISLDKIDVVPQSIDHDIFYPEKINVPERGSQKLISMVGDFNPRKRFDLLIEAVKGMNDVKLVIAGPVNAWAERYKSIARTASTLKNVQIAGELKQADLRNLLSSSDLVVYLSEGEGFGSIPIESMACGTNVLVNDLDIFRETLADKAFYCNLEINSIRKNIYFALDHLHGSSDLIEYSKKYSIERMAVETAKVYGKVSVKSKLKT